MVPMSVRPPPLLVPPPQSTMNQERSSWALAEVATSPEPHRNRPAMHPGERSGFARLVILILLSNRKRVRIDLVAESHGPIGGIDRHRPGGGIEPGGRVECPPVADEERAVRWRRQDRVCNRTDPGIVEGSHRDVRRRFLPPAVV